MFVCLFVGVCVPVHFCVCVSRRLFCFLSSLSLPPPLRFSFFFSYSSLLPSFFKMRLN